MPSKQQSEFFDAREKLSHENLSVHVVEREIDPELTIPTFFRECELTTVGQMVVDQYEIPKYKEVNPAYFTTISFPFLFGVMFGDVFAGSLLLIGGICAMISGMMGRHFLLLMGIFSLFCGLIYNDFTSVSMYLFGDSCWELPAAG